MSAQARRAPSARAAFGAVLRKELRTEVRTLGSVPAMCLFSVATFVLFHFGLDRDSVTGDEASGVLWVTLLLAAVLGVNRLFVADADEGGFDGYLLSPAASGALLAAKVATLFLYLVAVELVTVAAFALLLLGAPAGRALPALLGVLLLADAGIAVVGTLVAALAVRTQARELLGPLLALPLFVPIVLAASRLTAPLFAAGRMGTLPPRWLVSLALYDLLFAALAYAVFDFLLED